MEGLAKPQYAPAGTNGNCVETITYIELQEVGLTRQRCVGHHTLGVHYMGPSMALPKLVNESKSPRQAHAAINDHYTKKPVALTSSSTT